MSKQFYVGQLVILQNASYFFEYEGAPAVIVEGLVQRSAMNMLTMQWKIMHYYLVEALIDPPMQFSAEPHQLRPLKGDPEVFESERDDIRELENS